MSNQGTMSVVVIGISLHEQGVLRRLFMLTSSRRHAYTLSPLETTSIPDICLIDGDEPSALDTWRERCARDPVLAAVPMVMVSAAESWTSTQCTHLQRPFLAPRVLKVLDQVATAAQEAVVTRSTPRRKVLVVDDSVSVRKQVELELKRFDIDADFAESGEQALDLLSREQVYDLIFLDVVLPGVDGYTVCKTIKRDKFRKQTPVIMLTGKGSPFDRVRGKLAGCNTYLTKPVARKAFEETVHKYLAEPLRNLVMIS